MSMSRIVSRVYSRATKRSTAAFSHIQAASVAPCLIHPSFPDFRQTSYLPRFSVSNYSLIQQLGLTSTATPEVTEKEQGGVPESEDASGKDASEKTRKQGKALAPSEDSASGDKKVTDFKAEIKKMEEEIAKLVKEKEELRVSKDVVEKKMDKVLRSYAEMQNISERTKREATNSKKFAIENFAKNLLDVADNLERALSTVKKGLPNTEETDDPMGVLPLLKTLQDGVEMTDKQLAEVFKKFGILKFDPAGEPFDPHQHNAVFQVQDNSKPPGTVASVLKVGYMLHDRVIRPADVSVTCATEDSSEPDEDGDKECDT